MIKLTEMFNFADTSTYGRLKPQLGQVIPNPYARAFAPQVKEGEGEDHEVSMAQNQLESIIKAATELKSKIGNNEKDIPAWIQDHITNAENYINQASSNYHEYGNGGIKENAPCWKGYTQYGMKKKDGKEVPNCVPVKENVLKEVRSVKVVQSDIDKVLASIQTALSQYKAHKGSADEKKHVDNLKKLTKLRKDLEDEMELSVSKLYQDAEFDV